MRALLWAVWVIMYGPWITSAGMTPRRLAAGFRDFALHTVGPCRYSNCSHTVRAAITLTSHHASPWAVRVITLTLLELLAPGRGRLRGAGGGRARGDRRWPLPLLPRPPGLARRRARLILGRGSTLRCCLGLRTIRIHGWLVPSTSVRVCMRARVCDKKS